MRKPPKRVAFCFVPILCPLCALAVPISCGGALELTVGLCAGRRDTRIGHPCASSPGAPATFGMNPSSALAYRLTGRCHRPGHGDRCISGKSRRRRSALPGSRAHPMSRSGRRTRASARAPRARPRPWAVPTRTPGCRRVPRKRSSGSGWPRSMRWPWVAPWSEWRVDAAGWQPQG